MHFGQGAHRRRLRERYNHCGAGSFACRSLGPAGRHDYQQNLQWDVFCNGGGTFPDGRFLIVGGTDQYDPFYGEARTTVFDPVTEKFNDVENMAHGRWYANVTLSATAD